MTSRIQELLDYPFFVYENLVDGSETVTWEPDFLNLIDGDAALGPADAVLAEK